MNDSRDAAPRLDPRGPISFVHMFFRSLLLASHKDGIPVCYRLMFSLFLFREPPGIPVFYRGILYATRTRRQKYKVGQRHRMMIVYFVLFFYKDSEFYFANVGWDGCTGGILIQGMHLSGTLLYPRR